MSKQAKSAIASIETIEFQTLAEDAPVMLWLTNKAGKIIFTNSKWKHFIGDEKVKSEGGNAWFEALHPDDKERCLNTFEAAFATHRSFHMEYRLRRLDGVYRTMLDTGEPYISQDGKFSGFIGSSTDITEQKNFEEQLQHSHTEMEKHNNEMKLLNKLNSFIQICRTLEETYPVILHYARELFPNCTGSIYLLNESKTVVESMVSWGAESPAQVPIIAPDDCWSLRRGKPHIVHDIKNGLVCAHIKNCSDYGYTCVPIIAQGDMIGIIHLQFPTPAARLSAEEIDHNIEAKQRLVNMTADNLALALVSLKLREALKSQSIKDPLTHLYNRRYMEESLEREYARCKRASEVVAVLMLDIDHFKSYNDNHGHDVGDKILAELGQLLLGRLRKSDIPCRYGGEEFLLILPSAPLTIAVQRAEELRADIGNMHISYKNQVFDNITVSIGVAVYPLHADSPQTLINSADEALYEAKHTGRNKVVTAKTIIPRNDKSAPINKQAAKPVEART